MHALSRSEGPLRKSATATAAATATGQATGSSGGMDGFKLIRPWLLSVRCLVVLSKSG